MSRILISKDNAGKKLNISYTQNKKLRIYPFSFTPNSISNCKLWISADYGITTDGNGVIQTVIDRSSNGNNLTYSSGSPKIAQNIINGKPVFNFITNSGRLTGNDINIGKTIYAVVKNGNTLPSQYACIVELEGGGLYSAILPTYWGSYFYGEKSAGNNQISTNTAAIIASISNNGITYKFRRDGSQIYSASNGNGFYPRSTLYFGNDGGGGQPCNCYVAELIIYDREIDDTEAAQIENYLNTKYAIY